jgi:hypothetical protein
MLKRFVLMRVVRMGMALAGGFVLAAFVVPSSGARAGEITSIVDEHGHKIFVNAADVPAASHLKKTRGSRGTSSLETPPAEISNLVEKTSAKHQVDPKLVHAIIQVESGYNTRAVSRKGAQGLMQLIPATASRFGVQNSFNAGQNIEGGVSYLRYLLDLFNGNVPLSVAAYNAGEHAVLRTGGIPQYSETVDYVQRVTNLYDPGNQKSALMRKFTEAAPAMIYRLVDAQGIVHYTNGDGI